MSVILILIFGWKRTPRNNNFFIAQFYIKFIINNYIPIYAQRGDAVEDIDIQCRNGELKLKNKSAYQFSAMLTADDHEEKLVILRQTEMDKSFAKETKIKVNQGERLIHECIL